MLWLRVPTVPRVFTGVTVTWVGAGVKQLGVTGEDWWNVDEVLLLGTESLDGSLWLGLKSSPGGVYGRDSYSGNGWRKRTWCHRWRLIEWL